MYTLARTQKIYGSFQSSFSEMAAQIGGTPLEILKLWVAEINNCFNDYL